MYTITYNKCIFPSIDRYMTAFSGLIMSPVCSASSIGAFGRHARVQVASKLMA